MGKGTSSPLSNWLKLCLHWQSFDILIKVVNALVVLSWIEWNNTFNVSFVYSWSSALIFTINAFLLFVFGCVFHKHFIINFRMDLFENPYYHIFCNFYLSLKVFSTCKRSVAFFSQTHHQYSSPNRLSHFASTNSNNFDSQMGRW